MTTNEFGQHVGPPLDGWSPPPLPPPRVLAGRSALLEPLEPSRHGPGLWSALARAPDSIWTYMTFGPFASEESFASELDTMAASEGWLPYCVIVEEKPLGFASYLRVQPHDGVIEIGGIVFSPGLQRTTAATEAIYLMLEYVFALGYRRCEWKCDDLNQPSRRAAERLGFSYEGTFRQATHYKSRNRDTAWYAIIDRDWPSLAHAFLGWLAPQNFSEDGKQVATLEEMREK